MKSRILCWLCLMSVVTLRAQVPFYLVDNLIDTKDASSLGLAPVEGAETVVVFAPGAKTDHFSHGVVMTSFKEILYCMWQSSAATEDTDDTWVAYARSTDDGKTWSSPMKLASVSVGYCSSGGWWVNGDTLVAYINVWSAKSTGKNTSFKTSVDGLNWSDLQTVKMADGSDLSGIFEQDPHRLPSGRILSAAHFTPGLKLCPIYTDDPSGVRGWKKGVFPYQDNGAQSREMEPSFFLKPGGDTVVMVMRDNKQPVTYRKMASISTDQGATWTDAVVTNVLDSKAKQSAGNLPDGTAFLASNPTGWSLRVPLALLLSADGNCFDHGYLLRGADDLPAKRYTANSSKGYSYPKSMMDGDWLYVAYAVNKEDVAYTRVPWKAIQLRAQDALNPNKTDALRMACSGRVLTVSLPLAEKAELSMYDFSGRLVMKESWNSSEASFTLPEISGIHMVLIRTAQRTYTGKIRVE